MSNTNYFGLVIVYNLLLATRFQAFELTFRTVKVKAHIQDQ